MGLRMGGLILILPLILRKTTSDELGIWYVFQAIASFVALMDLGFGPTVSRNVSFLWAGAEKVLARGLADKKSEGEPNWKEMVSLIATMRWYYFLAGFFVVFFIGLGGGWWIWHKTEGLDMAKSMRGAWVFYVLGLGLNMTGSLWPACLGGINRVREGQQISVYALVANYVVSGLGLLFGFGLWALTTGQILQGFLVRFLGKKELDRHISPDLISYSIKSIRPKLVLILWPMAWRAGALSVGAFLITQANTLVCSARLSLSETASYGLTLQLISALVGVSAVWVTVKAPLLAQLRAKGQLNEVENVFVQRLRLSMLMYIVGACVIILLGPLLIYAIHSKTPLLTVSQVALLLFFMMLELHHSLYSHLVFAENENPFVVPALVSGVTIVLLSYFTIPYLGVTGVILSFGLTQLAFNNWWTVLRALRGLRVSPAKFFRSLFIPEGKIL